MSIFYSMSSKYCQDPSKFEWSQRVVITLHLRKFINLLTLLLADLFPHCRVAFMIYSAHLDSNEISVCSVFSQYNSISLFIVLQKCQIFRKYLVL